MAATTGVTDPDDGRAAERRELRWRVDKAVRELNRAHADLLGALAEFDRSGAWAIDGARSCAAWLAERHGIARSTAREWLRVSHELRRCPELASAVGERRLSYSAAREVSRLTPHHPDRASDLVALGCETAIGDLRRALARWLHHNETPQQQDDRHERETRLSVREEADGMAVMTLVLPSVEMAAVVSVIDAEVVSGAGFDAGSPTPRGRTFAGQRARCLQQIVTTGSGRSVVAEVVVHVRADGCSMEDGTPVSDNAVASMLDTGFVRALIHDAQGRPIDASGRRRPTARQLRVVTERHRHRCVDCGSPHLLELDHDPPYEQTCHTVVDELVPRCSSCHRARHRSEAPGSTEPDGSGPGG